MSKKAWLVGLSMVMLSLGVAAQTPNEDDDVVSPERLRMAFDRSELAEAYGAPRGGYFGYRPSYDFGQRYAATGYAHARRSADLGVRFWNTAAPRHQTHWITPRRGFGRRGELFLMTPTFLAPVLPFNEHAFEK